MTIACLSPNQCAALFQACHARERAVFMDEAAYKKG